MQNRTFPRKPNLPLPKPQGVSEDSTGLITSFIRIVDEISREHVSSSACQVAQR